MTRRSVPFRSADVTRACKGVMAAGLTPKRAEIGADGKIVMVFDTPHVRLSSEGTEGPLDTWRRENGEG